MNRWLIDALAVWRLTRLVTLDGITDDVRDAVEAWANERPRSLWREKARELSQCPHCVSVWVALGLVFVVRRQPWWPRMADALALAACSSLIADVRDAAEL